MVTTAVTPTIIIIIILITIMGIPPEKVVVTEEKIVGEKDEKVTAKEEIPLRLLNREEDRKEKERKVKERREVTGLTNRVEKEAMEKEIPRDKGADLSNL